ncbi:MAG: tetratricopeptide repeat protein [Bacteroidetes bacterium]|nr:tetratricopeptide repeat protein [Bacteroidota bacterium]
MTCKITGLALVLLVLLPLFAEAQDDRLSEQDINRQALYIEANQHRILGNYAKAIKIFEDLLVEEASNPALNYELARTYESVDKLQAAIDQVRIAADLEPENQWYAVYLGDLYQKTGQDKQAAGVYENLADAHPESEDYYYKWAYFLVRANESAKALKVYEIMEKRFGMSEELTRRKHTLYLGIGDFKKAEKELVNLVEAFPQHIEYLHLLAGFYDQMQEEKKALEVYKNILQIDPGDTKAAIAVAREGTPGNDDVNYLRSLQAVFVKADVELDAKMVQLIPYIQKVADTGDQELAAAVLNLLQILDEVHPREAKVYAGTADTYYYSGDKEKAVTYYAKAIQEDESVYEIWEQYLISCLETGNMETLLDASESALDVFPNQAMIFYLNGLAYYNTGNATNAISSLEQALMMTGRNLPLRFKVYHLLGMAYQTIDRPKRSGNAYSKALELDPDAAEVLTDYSYLLALEGDDLAKAKEMAGRANEITPNNPQAQHTYGWVLYRLEKYKAARDWIGRAVEQLPEASIVLEHYGDVLYQLGESEAAISFWERASLNGGGSEFLERKIADGKLYE